MSFQYTENPATPKGRATRRRIVRAAELEFGQKGYHDTAIHGIAARAGVGGGTFYLYFRDKEDVLRAVVCVLRERVHCALGAAARRRGPRPGAAERSCLETYVAFMNRHRGVRRIVRESEFIQRRAFAEYRRKLSDSFPAMKVVLQDPERF